MLKMKQFAVNCIPIKKGFFFLFAYDNEDIAECHYWVEPLFQWHKGTFYGSTLEANEVEVSIGNRMMRVEGVTIHTLDALELFGTEPFNAFVRWDFDDFSQTLMAISPVIYESIVKGAFGPDFGAWQKGMFQWKVPERVWNEFLPGFWETKVDGWYDLDGKTEPIQMKDFVTFLFNDGVEIFLTRKPLKERNWQEKKEVLENALEQGMDLASFFDEKRFLQWVGMEESQFPFSFGLQLEEPQEDGDMWHLTTILRDRKKQDTIFVLKNHAGRGSRIPKRWQQYADEIVAEQKRICRFIPWLANEEVDFTLEDEIVLEDPARPPLLIKEELFEDEALDFLTVESEKLLLLGVEILLPSWWESMKNANMRLKAQVKSGSSPSFVGLDALLNFEWRVSMNNVDLSEAEFRKLVEENRRLVNINGQWMKLDPAFIKKMQTLMEKAEKEGMRVQDFIQQQLLYGDDEFDLEDDVDEDNDQSLFARIQIELHPKLREFVANLVDLSDLPDEKVPAALQGELRPYQRKGMNWLYFLRQYGFGACLADDMGLGKTIQLIAYLLLVKERETESGPALIICPTSVLGNWQKELEKFAPSLNVYLHYGSNRAKGKEFTGLFQEVEKQKDPIKLFEPEQYDVVLTTYGLSHLDFDELSTVNWGTIVLDEAQNIKNAATKQSRAIRKLRGKHHIALTGTPMENRLTELWSIFDFINKGYLGSLSRFQERFVIPIEREHDEKKIEELRRLIRPFLLRRTKKDEEVALNLPDKIEQKAYCPLTGEQAAIYEQIVRDTFDRIAELSGIQRRGLVLQLLGRLKQLCDHPALYLKEMNWASSEDLIKRSTKLEKLVEIFDTILAQHESGLIFTQYIGMGEIIQSVLEERYGVRVPFLNGSTNKQQRDKMIAEFQNGDFPILLLSLKAGGTGLNLTTANHVIHYDRWWNPAVENQATDRAYRIGQTKFVHVHKFIATGTLEEKIDAMLEKKQALNEEIIQSDQWIVDLSDDELYDILRLD
jgi:SNF2 family DNA or RNA helicase